MIIAEQAKSWKDYDEDDEEAWTDKEKIPFAKDILKRLNGEEGERRALIKKEGFNNPISNVQDR